VSDFSVVFSDAAGNAIFVPNTFVIVPQWYSAAAIGGPDAADIQIGGPLMELWQLWRWLGYRVIIRNRHYSPVWWGRVEEALIHTNTSQIGLSIKNMRNRVKVVYTKAEDTTIVSRETSWAEDAESVSAFGYQELIASQGNMSDSAATAYQAALLAAIGKPTASESPGDDLGAATLRCAGWWRTLGYRYYSQARGKVGHEVYGNADQIVGQGLPATANDIGFAPSGKISSLQGKLARFEAGHSITISGSSSNNVSQKIVDVNDIAPHTLTSTTISFDSNDDIRDTTNEALGFVEVDDFIAVSGNSVSGNNIVYIVRSADSDHITVHPKSVTTDAAGDTVSILRGNSIEADAQFTREFPHPSYATAIVVHGQKVAQSFGLTSNVSWTAASVVLSVRKVGNPTDNLVVGLYTNSAGAPGTLIESASLSGSTISKNTAEVTWTLANSNTLSYGVLYWLQISRSGANDYDDFYVVEVDEDAAYAGGTLLLYTGSAWVARDPNASLIFKILGAEETTTQISNIILEKGQFLAGLDILSTASIKTNQYRDEVNTALDEIQALLDLGTSTGRRLLATVTAERYVRIQEQAARDATTLYLRASDGRLLFASGAPVEHGQLPVGHWVERADIPQPIGAIYKLSPAFLERAQFNCADGALALEWQGMPDAWNLEGVSLG
jgi:hypothetical protein